MPPTTMLLAGGPYSYIAAMKARVPLGPGGSVDQQDNTCPKKPPRLPLKTSSTVACVRSKVYPFCPRASVTFPQSGVPVIFSIAPVGSSDVISVVSPDASGNSTMSFNELGSLALRPGSTPILGLNTLNIPATKAIASATTSIIVIAFVRFKFFPSLLYSIYFMQTLAKHICEVCIYHFVTKKWKFTIENGIAKSLLRNL